MTAALTVDQSLVDNFLERVNRFVENVKRLEDTLASMKDSVQEKTAPMAPERAGYMHQENTTADRLVTADDIDIDMLLKGVNLDVSGVSM